MSTDSVRNISTLKPQQRLSYAEKVEKDNQWGKNVINYYLKHAYFYSEYTAKVGAKKDLALLYKIHNNQIPDEWFNPITDPFNVQDPAHKQQPAVIRKTNIARPVIEKILGEYAIRPFSWYIEKMGEEGYNKYLEQLTGKLHENIKQHFLNGLDPAIFEQAQQEQREVPLPEKVKESMDDSYIDSEVLDANKLLKHVVESVYFFEKSRLLFKDFAIAGEEYTQKDVRDDQIEYERVSPLDLWYIKSYYSPYIEDGEVAIRRILLTPGEVVDRFYREIEEEQLQRLDTQNYVNGTYIANFLTDIRTRNFDSLVLNKIPVYYVTWKSQKKVGFVTWIDEFGQEYEDVVSEDYIKNPDRDEKIQWKWINEIWEGYKIGKEDFLQIRPLPYQRNELNNISKCKLPINGRCYSDDHASNVSIYELMIEWVKLFIICNYRLERMIAKSKDKILLLDKAVIPQDAEWDEEKFFYYADTLGFALIDRSNRAADRGFNQYQVLDMRLYEDIQSMISLLEWIKQQCYSTIGVTDQWLGDVKASENVGNVNSAVGAAKIAIEDLFIKHEEFLQRELQGLLDLSRIAYRDGFKSLTYTDDRRVELLNINPDVYSYLDLALKVQNSAKSKQVLDQMKMAVQPYLQNGGKMSSVLEVLEAESTAKIKHVLRTIERKEQEQLERQSQDEQQSQQQHEQDMLRLQQEQAQIASIFKQQEINLEWDRKDNNELIKGDIAMELANITALGDGDGDVNNNGILDINEVQKRAIDREKIYHDKNDKLNKDNLKIKELSLREKEIMLKDKQHKEKMESERMKTKAQIQIAKSRPKPASKK
jgi:hypothetical protein